VSVTDRDRGARRVTRAIDQVAKGATVTVGIHRDRGREIHPGSSETTVAGVAAIIEYGSESQPQRSFVRAVADAAQGATERALARAAERPLRGTGDARSSLGAVGEDLAARMRAAVPKWTGATAEAIEARVKIGRVS